jgi:hypothetical protein
VSEPFAPSFDGRLEDHSIDVGAKFANAAEYFEQTPNIRQTLRIVMVVSRTVHQVN